MAIINKQLKGDNLCNTSCAEKKDIIHPENCVEDVLMSSEGDTTLQDWIMGGLPTPNNTKPVMPNTLMEWLSIYYSEEHIGLPIASSSNIGGIKIGNTLSINSNSGVTNVNLNNIVATANDLGVVKIGNGLSIDNEGVLSLNSLPTASDRILGCININNTIEGLNLDSINAQLIDSIKYVPLNSIDDFTIEAVYAVPVNIVRTSTLSRNDSRAFISLPVNLFEYDNIRNAPSLASVARSGSYNDLSDTPTIPAAQVQSNWNQSNSSAVDFIKNKPTIPAAQIQSDWAQTDNTSKDYIKNKPSFTGNVIDGTDSSNIESEIDRVMYYGGVPIIYHKYDTNDNSNHALLQNTITIILKKLNEQNNKITLYFYNNVNDVVKLENDYAVSLPDNTRATCFVDTVKDSNNTVSKDKFTMEITSAGGDNYLNMIFSNIKSTKIDFISFVEEGTTWFYLHINEYGDSDTYPSN